MLGAGTDPEFEFGGPNRLSCEKFPKAIVCYRTHYHLGPWSPGPPGSVPGWEGTSASRVLTVSEAKAFQCTKPLHRLKATKSVMEAMEVPTVQRSLGSNRGSVKLRGVQPPSPIIVPSLVTSSSKPRKS